MDTSTTSPAPESVASPSPQPVVSEIVVPVEAIELDSRGRAVASSLAERLDVPVREVHIEVDVDHPEASHNDRVGGIVAELEADSLVVMATARAGDPRDPTSIAEALVRSWPGPVVLVGPHVRVPRWQESIDWTESLVVPLDGSPSAERAVPVALGLADSLDVPTWFVQVVDPKISRKVLELRAAGERVSESGYLRQAASDASVTRRVGWEIIHGDDPAGGVLRFARDQGASMIVATTRGASGVERIVFGSVCMALVSAGTHPVVVVGPDGSDEDELTC